MIKFLLIGLGGAIGSILRYIVGKVDYSFSNGIFPISTFIINITGSFGIGFFWSLFDRFTLSPNIRFFLFVGVFGGYTTFSTFSLETFNLLRDGEYKIAFANIFFSFTLGIIAVFLGYLIFRFLLYTLKY